eukprot:2984287-Rhodomonas_salina.1
MAPPLTRHSAYTAPAAPAGSAPSASPPSPSPSSSSPSPPPPPPRPTHVQQHVVHLQARSGCGSMGLQGSSTLTAPLFAH